MRFLAERPYLISLALLAAVIAWMFAPVGAGDESDPVEHARAKPLQKVSYRLQHAKATELELIFTGRTRADQRAQLAAELDGTLVRFDAERGAAVAAGEPIARISTGSINAAIRSARAERDRARADYDAQRQLVERGLTPAANERTALATLETARARVDEAEREWAKSRILAPFAGVIAEHHAEAGDFMGVGKPVATLIDLDPIRAVGDVTERDVTRLSTGDRADIVLLNGERLNGAITFIAPEADPITRTFRVEVKADNPDGELSAGLTVQIRVALDTVDAYKVSPALLTLSAEGEIQVATVDEDNRVHLNPVELIQSERDGVWVRGLPDPARIITLGQGFVYDGDLVEAIPEANGARGAESDA